MFLLAQTHGTVLPGISNHQKQVTVATTGNYSINSQREPTTCQSYKKFLLDTKQNSTKTKPKKNDIAILDRRIYNSETENLYTY